MGISQNALARDAGVPPRRINEIVLGKRELPLTRPCVWPATSGLLSASGLTSRHAMTSRSRGTGSEPAPARGQDLCPAGAGRHQRSDDRPPLSRLPIRGAANRPDGRPCDSPRAGHDPEPDDRRRDRGRPVRPARGDGGGRGRAGVPAPGAVGQPRSLWVRGRRRLSAVAFGGVAVVGNAFFAAVSVAPDLFIHAIFLFLWVFVAFPATVGPGAAWALLATAEDASPRRPARAAWLTVVVLAMLPLATIVSLWPLHLAFHVQRPTLERLADGVAAGKPLGGVRWVGPFRIEGAKVDPTTGSVGLLIDPNPNGPTGFVRLGPAATPDDRRALIRGDVGDIHLADGWYYLGED